MEVIIIRRSKNAYNHFVCPNCYNKLNKCTCEHYPPWTLIFIDEGIQDHIRKLNEKGYRTNGCCESHFDGNLNLYISFVTNYNVADAPTGNKGRKSRCEIVYPMPKDTKEHFEKTKAEKLAEIMNWIENLPDIR